MWYLSYDTFPHSFLVVSSNEKRKEKEKKRNINNDLAVLPSHNIGLYTNFWKEEVKTSFWILSGNIIWDLIGYKTLEYVEFVFFVILGIGRRAGSKWTCHKLHLDHNSGNTWLILII